MANFSHSYTSSQFSPATVSKLLPGQQREQAQPSGHALQQKQQIPILQNQVIPGPQTFTPSLQYSNPVPPQSLLTTPQQAAMTFLHPATIHQPAATISQHSTASSFQNSTATVPQLTATSSQQAAISSQHPATIPQHSAIISEHSTAATSQHLATVSQILATVPTELPVINAQLPLTTISQPPNVLQQKVKSLQQTEDNEGLQPRESNEKSTQVVSHSTGNSQKENKKYPMRFLDLLHNLSHVEGTISYCMDLGLIPSSRICHRCGEIMRLKPCSAAVTSDGYIWQCRKQKGGIRCDTSRSIRAGSWFSQSNLTLEEILQITYWWTQMVTEDFLVYQTAINKPSVLDWCNYCRELCLTYLLKQSQPLGGPNTIIEIDESKFDGCNGHRLSGQWIFSGIQQQSNWTCFIFPVGEKKDGASLIEIIEQWVKPGTTLLCNWKPFERLTGDGYNYLTLSHSMTFKNVDETELGISHTESSCNFWKNIRSSVSSENLNSENVFDSAMGERIWRKQQGDEDVFLSFIKAVKFVYS